MKLDSSFDYLTIKDYKYWTLQVACNQSYLGRCIIWCKRDDAIDLSDMSPEESSELVEILKNLKEAEGKSFGASWFNYSFLGNGTRHLHCHFVPRYQNPVEFSGTIFKDELWGNNFKTDPNFETTDELREAVRLELKKYL